MLTIVLLFFLPSDDLLFRRPSQLGSYRFHVCLLRRGSPTSLPRPSCTPCRGLFKRLQTLQRENTSSNNYLCIKFTSLFSLRLFFSSPFVVNWVLRLIYWGWEEGCYSSGSCCSAVVGFFIYFIAMRGACSHRIDLEGAPPLIYAVTLGERNLSLLLLLRLLHRRRRRFGLPEANLPSQGKCKYSSQWGRGLL